FRLGKSPCGSERIGGVLGVFAWPSASVPEVDVGQLMGDHPSREGNGSLLDGSLDHNGTAWFAPAAESHRHLHPRVRPGIEIVYDKFRIVHQIGPDLAGEILDDSG